MDCTWNTNHYVARGLLLAGLGTATYLVYRRYRRCACAGTPVVNVYENDKLVWEYLHFHYADSVHPLVPKEALDFPCRCTQLCISHVAERAGARALDIGCAVGRSSFELARHFEEVVGIDYSHAFVRTCGQLKKDGQVGYRVVEEGDITSAKTASIAKEIDRRRVSFEQGDACALGSSLGEFDCVLAANLICRLYEPKEFLRRVKRLIRPGGILVITCPFTWMTEFTAKDKWLGGFMDASGAAVTGPSGLRRELCDTFDLVEEKDMPFVIRETARKHQWTAAYGSVWRKRMN